jgi:protein SCO1/2
VTRHVLLIVAASLVVAGCGSAHRVAADAPSGQRTHAIAIEPPVAAPAFLLRDQSGVPVGPQRYRGRWTVVTFLYTQCPDVCPLIAGRLVAAQRQAPGVQVIAVSVDPKRDTRSAVRSFLAAHHAGRDFHYVTGSRSALSAVWRRYHIGVLPGPDGTVSHNAVSVLVDPKGKERFLLDSQFTARDVVAAVR